MSNEPAALNTNDPTPPAGGVPNPAPEAAATPAFVRSGAGLMRLVLLLIALPALALTIILNLVFGWQTSKLGNNEARLRGTSMAKELAVNVSLYMLDRAGVQGIAQKTLDQVDEDLVYVVVKDAKGEVIAEARKAEVAKAAKEELWEKLGPDRRGRPAAPHPERQRRAHQRSGVRRGPGLGGRPGHPAGRRPGRSARAQEGRRGR
ncbi:MAG: hypothetical protein QM765_32460 [Myxococcales bacterium]